MQPSQIGPYAIEKKIGAGGMGTVFLGRHRETGQLAAVKVLPASLAREEGFVARFNREIDAMKRLKNPHVVELLDSGVDNETYYYSMEYVDGETLTNRLIRDKRIPWPEAVEMTLQICSALKAAHDAGIVHRDLKPSNLLIAMDGTVKLTDFGVAQVFAGGKLTVTGGIIGTAEYMSPEQAQGTRASKKSDLYSLGAVLYAMVTGRPPFTGKTTLEVIQKHRHAQFDRPSRFVPDLPHWLDEIICQLLEKDPDKRFPDAFVLTRRLQEMQRKIELRSNDEAYTGPTRVDGSNVTAGAVMGDGPGVATLMRDLVQHEIRESQKMSPLASFFDNLWVILACLVLVIGGGVAWFRSKELSPEQKFEAGIRILEEPESREWIRARDEYFAPLVATDPDAWQEKSQPYLDRIEVYDWKRKLTPKRGANPGRPAGTEGERLMQMARHAYESGETARSEAILSSLVVILNDEAEQQELRKLAAAMLAEIQTANPRVTNGESLASRALSRAKQQISDGKMSEATELLRAIVTLYRENAAERRTVQECEDLLKKSSSR